MLLSDANKMPKVDNNKEGSYILSHSFRGFSPWSVDALVWGQWWCKRKHDRTNTAHLAETRKQRERKKNQYPSVPFRTCTSDVTSNQQVPHPKDSTTFQKHTSWWLTLQCMALYIYVCMCLFILWPAYPWLDGICKWSYDSWMWLAHTGWWIFSCYHSTHCSEKLWPLCSNLK